MGSCATPRFIVRCTCSMNFGNVSYSVQQSGHEIALTVLDLFVSLFMVYFLLQSAIRLLSVLVVVGRTSPAPPPAPGRGEGGIGGLFLGEVGGIPMGGGGGIPGRGGHVPRRGGGHVPGRRGAYVLLDTWHSRYGSSEPCILGTSWRGRVEVDKPVIRLALGDRSTVHESPQCLPRLPLRYLKAKAISCPRSD